MLKLIFEIIGFIALGCVIGGCGTLVGAGGGFLLTPVMLLLFPNMPAETVTAISMTTIFFNSSSGSVAYARMRRIDYKTGLIFAAVTLPGVIMGTWLTYVTPRSVFNMIFGGFMIVFAVVIFMKSRLGDHSAPYDKPGAFRARRIITDKAGHQTAYSFNILIGVLVSFVVGFLSGFLGIGGGIVHVPVLVFLGFPAHFATATSHFVLVFSSFTSWCMHLINGSLKNEYFMAFSIAVGAVAGAQIGAFVSKKIKGSVIMICLAAALVIAGIRILISGLLK
ncbi:MAG: sulfite exporter TauE/SafE family protein [Oscillospiraceae bacterium]|nr:sulfite exporter TauE/SafE family protein [Oscillospiraceae bacterium]